MSKHPPRRHALGDYLRARREHLVPEQFGLPRGQRRRTPGLRREEVAQLCGISPTWLTWIEQGRTTAVSVPTLVAIATGLGLSTAERQHLFRLAARADPKPARGPPAPRRDLQPLVDAIRSPAYVLDRHWDAVAWNRPAASLLGTWLRGDEPNLLRFVFLAPEARRFIVDWRQRSQRLVAEFRADTADHVDDPARQALVETLTARSPEFAACWRQQEVLSRDGGRRAFRHPVRGRCEYVQYTLRPAAHPDLKVTLLVA